VLACRVFGHRYRFTSEGATMHWRCQRGCGTGSQKQYASPEDAARFAAAFDVEDRDQLGRNKVLLSLLPLRLFRRYRRRAVMGHEQGGGGQRGVGRDRPRDGA
jgi:hypothetical protein